MSLHAAMTEMSLRTMRLLEKAKTVGHQPLEETVTDLNILGLTLDWPSIVRSRTHTRPEEGRTGADWEWWFVDATRTKGTRVLVQAKILNLRRDVFTSLHYRSGNPPIYQSKKLQATAKRIGAYALICLYTNHRDVHYLTGKQTLSDGCMVMPASALSHLQRLPRHRSRTKAQLSSYWIPLPLLFCDCEYSVATAGAPDLADYVSHKLWTFVRHQRGYNEPIPSRPLPSYVHSILGQNAEGHPLPSEGSRLHNDGRERTGIPTRVKGVVVFTSDVKD